jgi:hypothetical protein
LFTLIPKEEHANDPRKLRPISLSNVIYKTITKVIANRLKPLRPLLISMEHVHMLRAGIYWMVLFWHMKKFTLSRKKEGRDANQGGHVQSI